MTPKQFYIIRNLLSWIVIALFLLIGLQYAAVPSFDFSWVIGKASICIAAIFLIAMFFRVMFYKDLDEESASGENCQFEKGEKLKKVEQNAAEQPATRL